MNRSVALILFLAVSILVCGVVAVIAPKRTPGTIQTGTFESMGYSAKAN